MSATGRNLITFGLISGMAVAGYLWKDATGQVNPALSIAPIEQPTIETLKTTHPDSVRTAIQVANSNRPNEAALSAPEDLQLTSTPPVVALTTPAAGVSVEPDSDSNGLSTGRRMTSAVAKLAAGPADKQVEVIVAWDSNQTADSTSLANLDAEVVAGFDNLPMRVLRLPAGSLTELSEHLGVKVIDVDSPVQAATTTARETARVPLYFERDYYEPASNVSIAVIDSGVASHGDLNLRASLDCLGVTKNYLESVLQAQTAHRVAPASRMTVLVTALTSQAPRQVGGITRCTPTRALHTTHLLCHSRCSTVKAPAAASM